MATEDVAKQRRAIPPALIVGTIVGLGLLAFVVQNTDKSTVHWLFFKFSAPLWIVLLVAMAAAVVAGELISMAVRRARRNR